MISTDIFQESLKQKMDLINKIQGQMADDVKNGVLKPKTIEIFNRARNGFDAAIINLGNPRDALHHYARGCTNLGEFMARQKVDRGIDF